MKDANQQQQTNKGALSRTLGWIGNTICRTPIWLAILIANICAPFGSVSQFFSKLMGFMKENFAEVILHDKNLAKIVGRTAATCIPAIGTVGGIIWLNVAGCAAIEQNLKDICNRKNPPKTRVKTLLNLLTILAFAFPSGIPMSVLAKFNITFLLGGAIVAKLPWLRELGVYITWAIIGAGIGNVLSRPTKNLCRTLHLPDLFHLYSKEERTFDDCCSAIESEIKLELDEQATKDFSNEFLQALGFQPNETPSPALINDKLKQTLSNRESAQAFFKKLSIFNQPYPTQKNYWSYICAAFAIAASTLGAWHFKDLIASSYKDASYSQQQLFAWGGLLAYIGFWATSLTELTQDLALNPNRQVRSLMATFKYPSCRDITLRTSAPFLSGFFATMMVLIPWLLTLTEQSSNASEQNNKALSTTMTTSGFAACLAVSLRSIFAVWKSKQWVKLAAYDIAGNRIKQLGNAFSQISPAQQVETLCGLCEAQAMQTTASFSAATDMPSCTIVEVCEQSHQLQVVDAMQSQKPETLGQHMSSLLKRSGIFAASSPSSTSYSDDPVTEVVELSSPSYNETGSAALSVV